MRCFVLVANSSKAKLYHTDSLRTGNLKLISEQTHPESREKISDLLSDRAGHYQVDSSTQGSYGGLNNNPKKTEADHFAVQLAKYIKTNTDFPKGSDLIVIAQSHFYNLMKEHLHHNDSNTDKGKLTHISKDYTLYTPQELLTALREHMFVTTS
jgi:hypothetical protein